MDVQMNTIFHRTLMVPSLSDACHIGVLREANTHTFIPVLLLLGIETINIYLDVSFHSHREYLHPRSRSRLRTSIHSSRANVLVRGALMDVVMFQRFCNKVQTILHYEKSKYSNARQYKRQNWLIRDYYH